MVRVFPNVTDDAVSIREGILIFNHRGSKAMKSLRTCGPPLLLAFILVISACAGSTPILSIGSGHKAKVLCSDVFVSKRDPASILREDLAGDYQGNRYFQTKIDYEDRSVTASSFGLAKRKAVFRPGLGCTVVNDYSEEQVRSQFNPLLDHDPSPAKQDEFWPRGERVQTDNIPDEIDASKLRRVINAAFSEPDPKKKLRGTRAVVVVYNGRIIAERYAKEFSPDMPLRGWSMSKSVASALTGILVGQGKISIYEPAAVPEWQEPGDPRGKITVNQLLHMSSGLKFSEGGPTTDMSIMLFAVGDTAAYAANKPLEADPGSKFHYSTGTTHIIFRILRHSIGGTDADYFAFPRRELFDRVGMKSAILEPDASGTFMNHVYASPRDWARFGLLYLQDGVWEGERILPEGWVKYTSTPAPASGGMYGAQFWLKTSQEFRKGEKPNPSLPADMFFAQGFEGNHVVIIPSRNLVLVRLGLTLSYDGTWDLEEFIEQILDAMP